MRTTDYPRGFTLVEVLVASAVSTIVFGSVIIGAIALQKSFHASEIFMSSQIATTRLIDYLDGDLRSATTITFNGAPFREGEKTLKEGAILEVRKPKFYSSDDPNSSNYMAARELTATVDAYSNLGVEYGEPGVSETVVQYKRAYRGERSSICFIRVEDGMETVIVSGAEDIDCDLRMSSDGRRVEIDTWFISKYGDGTARVNSSGRVMLRNPRKDI